MLCGNKTRVLASNEASNVNVITSQQCYRHSQCHHHHHHHHHHHSQHHHHHHHKHHRHHCSLKANVQVDSANQVNSGQTRMLKRQILDRVKDDRSVLTKPDEDRRRRTIIIERRNGSFGFTLQTYGIHHRKDGEIELLTYVDFVEFNGPAFRAGMRPGDVILSINGRDMEKADHRSLVEYIQSCEKTMRMVVLFEDCVRKVELHIKYLKLKRMLHQKINEYEILCNREKHLLKGQRYTGNLLNDEVTVLDGHIGKKKGDPVSTDVKSQVNDDEGGVEVDDEEVIDHDDYHEDDDEDEDDKEEKVKCSDKVRKKKSKQKEKPSAKHNSSKSSLDGQLNSMTSNNLDDVLNSNDIRISCSSDDLTESDRKQYTQEPVIEYEPPAYTLPRKQGRLFSQPAAKSLPPSTSNSFDCLNDGNDEDEDELTKSCSVDCSRSNSPTGGILFASKSEPNTCEDKDFVTKL